MDKALRQVVRDAQRRLNQAFTEHLKADGHLHVWVNVYVFQRFLLNRDGDEPGLRVNILFRGPCRRGFWWPDRSYNDGAYRRLGPPTGSEFYTRLHEALQELVSYYEANSSASHLA